MEKADMLYHLIIKNRMTVGQIKEAIDYLSESEDFPLVVDILKKEFDNRMWYLGKLKEAKDSL